MNHTITAQNIYQESFHNLCFLSDVTKYADPISAIKKLNVQWVVEKDKSGKLENVFVVRGMRHRLTVDLAQQNVDGAAVCFYDFDFHFYLHLFARLALAAYSETPAWAGAGESICYSYN